MQFFRMILTWWHSYTFGTAFFTWRRGRLVGTDSQGNRYYVDKKGASINGKPRRWVIFNGDIEASRIPPEWHGWLHYTVDKTPLDSAPASKAWHKPHQINQTGLPQAHKPSPQKAKGTAGGQASGQAQSQPSSASYEAWQPPANPESDKPPNLIN